MNGVFFIKQNPCMRIRSKQPTAISTHILRPCFYRMPRLLSGKGRKGCGCLPAEAVPFSFSFSINITHYPLTFPLPFTLPFTFTLTLTLSLGFVSENLWFLYSKPLVFIPETIGFPFGQRKGLFAFCLPLLLLLYTTSVVSRSLNIKLSAAYRFRRFRCG